MLAFHYLNRKIKNYIEIKLQKQQRIFKMLL